MRWPRTLGGFAAVALQVARKAFQNVAAVRSACANAGCTARLVAAARAQTRARMTPPWQVKKTLTIAQRTDGGRRSLAAWCVLFHFPARPLPPGEDRTRPRPHVAPGR